MGAQRIFLETKNVLVFQGVFFYFPEIFMVPSPPVMSINGARVNFVQSIKEMQCFY